MPLIPAHATSTEVGVSSAGVRPVSLQDVFQAARTTL